ncbi:MAG: DUF1800 family protein [Actinomycetota bacterium]|nr:DUF1800 family protein [Actinomycetota bacterium]
MVSKRLLRGAISSLAIAAVLGAGYVLYDRFATSGIGVVKAEYLAQRILLAPSAAQIATLAQAPTAADAVNELFAAAPSAEVKSYQAALASFQRTAKNYPTTAAFDDTSYAYRLAHDPEQAQLKLYYLWENIFSVDAQDKDEGITYADVDTLHNLLYQGAEGSYLTLLQKVQGNYALDRYLNLTQSKAASPNENFARELMQLFMMGAYSPTDTSNARPNYSEEDVSSLSYILTGYRATVDHQVTFNPAQHFSGTKTFLGSSFNDPSGTIQYIAAKRSPQIAEFLASKLMHYYLSDTPSNSDLNSFASVILQNHFEILPSLKWLLGSDIMFRQQYMQADRYKTPLELVASYYSDLYGRNDYATVPTAKLLVDLNFTPYLPGSVFGRAGFNSNPLFYSGSILENWVHTTYQLLHPGTPGQLPPAVAAAKSASHTADQFITALSSRLYASGALPHDTQKQLVAYLGTDLSDVHLMDATSLMLDQPEFLTESGNLEGSPSTKTNETASGAASKLVVVRLRGGMDYQQLVANVSDPAYAKDRGSLALTPAQSSPLGAGYVLNNVASSLQPIVQAGQASFINAVGLPGQIRAHDIASRQMETGLAGDGVLANLQKHDPSRVLVSLSPTPPIMMSGTSSLQIGTSNQGLFPAGDARQPVLPVEAAFTAMMTSRRYPTALSQDFGQAMFLNTLARASNTPSKVGKSASGPGAATTSQQFATLEGLINGDVGNTYYLSATGNYDDHAGEAARFDPLAKDLFTNLAQFYSAESAKTKLTVVVFSEFGRTDVVNGSGGTDHGLAGGMIVLSNAMKLPTMLGTMNPSTDINDWTNTQIDERDVWSTIFNDVYSVPQNALFGRSTTLASAPVTIP